jgi:aminopeptidase
MRNSAHGLVLLVLMLVLGGCGAGEPSSMQGAPPVARAAPPDLEAIARSVVTRTARVREGDVVLITGGVRDLEFLENLAVEVRKLGADAIISLSSERLTRRIYDEVPERYDGKALAWGMATSGTATLFIEVDANETPDLLAHVPPARLNAISEAWRPVVELGRRRGVRTIEVGNGLYPTHARAARYGISRDELASTFWNALAADPAILRENGAKIRELLQGRTEIRITHPNGTDLTVAVDGGTAIIADGVVSEADEQAGGASLYEWLPAGEVFARTVPGSARGVVIADRHDHRGAELRQLRLEFAEGRLVRMSAASGLGPLQEAFDVAGDGKDILSVIDFGTNPGVPASERILTFVPAGMLSVNVGSDSWAGGHNDVTFNLTTHLPGTTVWIGDRIVVRDGRLQI